MRIVNMHEAKTKLSKLVEDALAGEEIILAKAGKRLVRLVPYEGHPQPRKPGRLKGKIKIEPDFDQTPEEIIAAFEGKE